MKLLKYTLLVLGGLLLVAGAVAAYVAATFDPNRYKPQIIAAVKEHTQRTLRLEGDIALSLWPNIAARVGKASLSERGSAQEFAAVEEARVSLKLMPLLSGEAVADTVTLRGLRANIVKRKDGTTNFEDLAGAPGAQKKPPAERPGEPLDFDVAGVRIENAEIRYTDQQAGTRYTVSGLDLATGRIAPGVPTAVKLSGRASSAEPKADLRIALATQVAFEPGRSVSLKDLALEANGAAVGLTQLALKASGGGVKVDLAGGGIAVEALRATLTGRSGQDALDVRAEAPRLHLVGEKAAGDRISVVASMTGPAGTSRATLALPGIEGTARAFRSQRLQLDLQLERKALAVQAKVESPLTGSIEAKQVKLPQLKVALTASGDSVPGRKLTGELAGEASVDGDKQRAAARLAGKVGESRMKAQVNATRFTPLALDFDVDMDKLDLDRYLAGAQADGGKKPAGKGGKPAASEPFDLKALRDLTLDGRLHVGALTVNGARLSDARMQVKARGGRVDIDPVAARLYQGTLASAVTIDARPDVPTFAVRHDMKGVNIGPLLRDAADTDLLEGRGNLSVDVKTRGNTVDALKRALDGKAAVRLADGAIKGIDIAGTLRSARARLGQLRGEEVQAADRTRKTDFSELTATLRIQNGVARNDDLSVKSPLLRGTGQGTINIAAGTLDYVLKASIVGTTKGQGGKGLEDLKGVTVPVRISGPMANLSYKLDYASLVSGRAKEAVVESLRKRLGGSEAAGADKKDPQAAKDPKASGDSPRDVLRGILGR